MSCFFAGWPDAGPCEGDLIRGHLIPQQLLRRTFPKGAVRVEGVWQRPVEALFLPEDDPPRRTLREMQDDPRCWVPICGGLLGLSGHHGMLDVTRSLRILRHQLPADVEEFAQEAGLGWYLDREYGPMEAAA